MAYKIEILFWEQLPWHWHIFSISKYQFHDSGFWYHVNRKGNLFKMPKVFPEKASVPSVKEKLMNME